MSRGLAEVRTRRPRKRLIEKHAKDIFTLEVTFKTTTAHHIDNFDYIAAIMGCTKSLDMLDEASATLKAHWQTHDEDEE